MENLSRRVRDVFLSCIMYRQSIICTIDVQDIIGSLGTRLSADGKPVTDDTEEPSDIPTASAEEYLETSVSVYLSLKSEISLVLKEYLGNAKAEATLGGSGNSRRGYQ